MPQVHTVKCPQCGKAVQWLPANRFRPFCSERCKQIDLGAWASENYRVPTSEPDDGDLGDRPPGSAAHD